MAEAARSSGVILTGSTIRLGIGLAPRPLHRSRTGSIAVAIDARNAGQSPGGSAQP
jgi:hypothetical protein